MIPVSGTRRTDSTPLGIVRATVLLTEPSSNTFVVLKGRTAGFYPAGCSERLPKLKKIIFQVHLKKKKNHTKPTHIKKKKNPQQNNGVSNF